MKFGTHLSLGNKAQWLLAGALGAVLLSGRAEAQSVFGETAALPVPALPGGLAAGDFNGDGEPDLAALFPGPLDVNQRPTEGTARVFLTGSERRFGEGKDSLAGVAPTALAAADFDNDKKLDLAVLHASTNTLSLLFGNGDGTFTRRADFVTGTSPSSVAAGDFNHDGYPDLAISDYGVQFPPGTAGGSGFSYGNQVEIWYGKGKGTFPQADRLSPGGGVTAPLVPNLIANPVQVAPTDLNGDGATDYVTANAGSTGVSTAPLGGSLLLFRMRNGSYGSPYDVSGDPDESLAQLATGDFNGDGRTDVAAIGGVEVAYNGYLSGGTDVRVWLNTAQGLIPQPGIPLLGTYQNLLRAADMNKDGKADLILASRANERTSIQVLPSRGDGTFGEAEMTSLGFLFNLGGFVVADFNADGNPDAALGTMRYAPDPSDPYNPLKDRPVYEARVAWGEARKETLFGPPIQVPMNEGDSSVFPITPIPSRFSFDANKDGASDLAVIGSVRGGRVLDVMLGDKSGSFQPNSVGDLFDKHGPYVLIPSAYPGDFDGDGKADLIVFYRENTHVADGFYALFQGGGNGNNFVEGTLQPFGDFPGIAGLGDFNGDLRTDLFFQEFGKAWVELGEIGAIGAAIPPKEPVDAEDRPYRALAADFNGDGKTDFAVTTYGTTSRMLAVFLGNTGDAMGIPLVQPHDGTLFQTGELTGDGKPDLLGTIQEGDKTYLMILPGKGDGTFGARIELPFEYAGGVEDAQIADFNGDGLPDMAYATWTGTATVLLGTGGGQFRADGEKHYIAPGTGLLIKGDYNGDGRPDIAYAAPGKLEVRLNVTGGSPSAQKGDLDSDGKVTVADAVLSLKWIVGFAKPESLEQRSRADMDGDGGLTVADTLLILRIAAGISRGGPA